MLKKSQKRHIAKTITWRVVGTIDTIVLSWIISGNPLASLKIGGAEVITKMILYYFHERLWFKTRIDNRKKRHLLKTVTWRILGTIDTIVLAWVITGSAIVGLKIGVAEVITKMVLYYLHESVWYKMDFGLENRKRRH
jgi:uncharacterized membrane protein